MARNLENKLTVITGGAQGIGYSVADKFLAKGARLVVIIDIDDKQGLAAVENLKCKYGLDRAEFIKCDITTDIDDATRRIFNKHSSIDVLVNNAGILNEYMVQKTIGINTKALMEWSVMFFERMRWDKGGKGGTVINMASIYGYRVDPFLPVYRGSKFAVIGFTRSFGHPYRYKKFGVRALAVCASFTKSKLTTNMKVNDDSSVQNDFDDFDDMLKSVPWQQVETVSDAVVDVFVMGDSGSAWLIEGSKPITQL